MDTDEILEFICNICIFEENFEYVQSVFDHVPMDADAAILIAPLAYTCTYRELFPGWQAYSKRVRAEFERRGRVDVDELMHNLE
jgi:hypothetical protein